MAERQPGVQTLAWFIDLYRKAQLNLTPPYQRWSVWNQAYRDYFVDTILNFFPMPPLFLHREIDADGNTMYHVVDGRQRLETIIAYTSDEFPTPASYEPFAGLYFKDLPVEFRKQVWEYLVPVEFLADTSENKLKDIFDRLNRNVAQLKPQELRHARFNGEFISLTERLAEQLPRGFPNISESDRRRMRAVEYVATLLLYFERGAQGTSVSDLDEVFAQWDDSLPALNLETRFLRTMAAIEDLVHALPDLTRIRYRNLADFYSLFAAIGDLLEEGWRADPDAAQRLLQFANRVEVARVGELPREADPDAYAYYDAARSASNDLGPRQTRIAAIKNVLRA